MHAYEVPRRQVHSPVPSSRPAPDPLGGPSATPIYDALYAEYVKSFRSLPGDRSGEEDLGFTAFGNIAHTQRPYDLPRPGSFSSSYGAYSAGAQSARRGTVQLSQGPGQAQGQTQNGNRTQNQNQDQPQNRGQGQGQGQWQRVGQIGRPHTEMTRVPAVPPHPRNGR